MNIIKKEFNKIKPQTREKIELYNSIMNKKNKKRNIIPRFVNALTTIVLVFVIGIGTVYAASRIFGFDFNFLNVFDYNEEDLTKKGVGSEILNLKVVDGDKQIIINNIIFDGNKMDLFADLVNMDISDFDFDILIDNKSISRTKAFMNLSTLIGGNKKNEITDSAMFSFEFDRELSNGTLVTFVYYENNKEYKIDIKVNSTITKTVNINTTGASLVKDDMEFNIYNVKVSPMGLTISVQCDRDLNNLDYELYEYMYYAYIGTKDKEYQSKSYPIIIEKIDETHAKILYSNEYLNPDDVTYIRVFNYKINLDGSVEKIGHINYIDHEKITDITDKGVYIYVGNCDDLLLVNHLAYSSNVKTHVALYDQFVIRLYKDGQLIKEEELTGNDEVTITNFFYDAEELLK